jgi:hypothetical protein
MRLMTSTVVATATLVAIAGTAGASLKQKSADFTADANEETEETATCKRGQEAVAGGFFVDADAGQVLPTFESQREGKRGWTYRLYSGVETEAAAYAYCDKSEPGLKVKSNSRQLEKSFVAEAVSARCGRGKEAVSGGFEAPLTKLAAVASKRSGKRRWEAQFIGPPGVEVTAYALCDKSEPGLKTKSASTTVPEGAPTPTSVVSRKCRRKQELRSGGFQIEFTDSNSDGGLVTGSQRMGKKAWETTGFSIGGDPELTAYAYCDKKEKN